MFRAIDRATKKLQRSAQLLAYRRLNWSVETNHRIRWQFEAFVHTSKQLGFPIELNVVQYDTPNEGVVQITAGQLHTGVVNRKYAPVWTTGESHMDTPVFETGGELVASLSASGHVHFIVHPRSSERMKPKETEVIILGPLDPTDVTDGKIQKALKRYLTMLQSSSILGYEDALTYGERLSVSWIRFRDLRSRYKLYRSLISLTNEWGKAIVAGLIAFVIGYVAAAKV